DALFLISSGIGRAFFLQLYIKPDSIELQSILLQGATDICHLRAFDSKHIDTLCKDGTYSRIKYNSKRSSLKDDPEALSIVLKDTLREMELCEESIKALESTENELTEKLASVNKTLYAIRSISQKRKIGVCNSLETTGFELTVVPVTKSNSIANSTALSSAFLRVTIKTMGFLKLESWELKLDLFPYIPYMVNKKSYSERGHTMMVSIQGFESQYENGAEKYLMWERDIPIDLNTHRLPLTVAASLTMDSTADQNMLLFPVSEMILDDLHFAMACTENMRLSDRTNQYPLERMLKEKTEVNSITRSYPFDYKRGVIRILVDSQMSQETYRCILSKLLNDGRTVQDIQQIIYDAEKAYYILAAFPASPIVLSLSRLSDTELELRFECHNPIALFKNEASLLIRLYFISLGNRDQDIQNAELLEELRSLEETIVSLQDQYHDSSKQGSPETDTLLWENLKKAVEKMVDLHKELPSCYIEF
ncbi:hypothetical protein K501DRAFT_197267, partial [Backusella circina FSU 941]